MVSSEKQSGHSVPNDANRALRVARALYLRTMGYTYAEIARDVGWADESGARKAVQAELSRVVKTEARNLKEHLVQLQLERIDLALRKAVMPQIEQGKHQLFAVDRLVLLLRHQAELLGLYPPKAGEAEQAMVVIREVPVGLLPAVSVEALGNGRN